MEKARINLGKFRTQPFELQDRASIDFVTQRITTLEKGKRH
ncbi:hypothetical protein BGP_6530 [Beggiatoa sp. PS]|nr:hypothetical protein BGP_6530 [Beggiatoa sp. PS]